MTDEFFSAALDDLREKGLLREPRVFTACDGRTITLSGKKYLLFCSNDYLGLSQDARIVRAVEEGLAKYGFGSGGSRLISGTRTAHEKLERAIAQYLRAESSVLFGTGYGANSGAIPALAGKGDVIFADKLNHASIIDGCLLSKAEFVRYPHADMGALERLLSKTRCTGRRWIVTDGLFSMDGDLAPLDVVCGLAKKYDAGVYLDDAHAFGVLGEGGRGTASVFGVEGKIDVTVGTLGKAAGGAGAFATGSKKMTDYLVNKARTYIFSTAIPPAVAEGDLKAVEILAESGDRRKSLLSATAVFNAEMRKRGLARVGESYIIPLVVGSADKAVQFAGAFLEAGIFIQAVRPPAVAEGSARLRLTLSSAQLPDDRTALLSAVDKLFDGRSA